MDIEDCKGCKTRLGSIGNCIWFNESLVCPCASCLIKVMCLNECELLQEHTSKVYKLEGILILSGQINYLTEDK